MIESLYFNGSTLIKTSIVMGWNGMVMWDSDIQQTWAIALASRQKSQIENVHNVLFIIYLINGMNLKAFRTTYTHLFKHSLQFLHSEWSVWGPKKSVCVCVCKWQGRWSVVSLFVVSAGGVSSQHICTDTPQPLTACHVLHTHTCTHTHTHVHTHTHTHIWRSRGRSPRKLTVLVYSK